MKSALRPWHQTIVLALVLFIHGSMLLMFVLLELEQGGSSEPIILVADEEREQLTERDWVAMNNSLPNTQMATLHQISPPSPEEAQKLQDELIKAETKEMIEEQQKEAAQEKKIDEALDLASQFLELPESKKTEALVQKKEEAPLDEKPLQKMPLPKETEKAPLSFAQLAQGFVNQIAQVDMAVESSRQGPADMTMVVMVNYFQKVLKNIGDSYSITNQMAPSDAQARDAHVMLALNKNGTIHSLNVTQSSGNQRVDNYLLQLVKHASSSFPPVPSSIKDRPLRLPILHRSGLRLRGI